MINWLARSAMVTFYPRSEQFPGIEDMDLDAYIAQYRRECAPLMWAGFVLGTVFFHLTPLFTVYLPLPAYALSDEDRERHAQRLVSHPIYYVRQPVFLLKMVAGLLWGADPAVRARLGLAPYPADPGTWRTS
ncbi:MAG: hypothetical protein Q8S73_06925 [Deltaproteobacteria bacterium]|nr:hypothetical protein [Myxococcales bacterium]MDP3213818.1 hypothetical protein [Deltaproteobacteria bacterium]